MGLWCKLMRYFVLALGLLALLIFSTSLSLRSAEREIALMTPADGVYPRAAEGVAEEREALEQIEFGPQKAGGRYRTGRPLETSAPELSLLEPPARELSLTGSVRDDLGTPLFFFHVAGEGRGPELEQHQIEPDGSFTLSGFGPGEQSVEFSAPGHETSSQVLEFPLAVEHEVVLRRLPRVSGVVVDAAGEPVVGASLVVFPHSVQFPQQLPAAISDAVGQFEFETPVGTFGVRVGTPGPLLHKELQFDLLPGRRVAGLVVRLRAGGVIEGFVHSRAGAGPAAGAPVSAVSEQFRKQTFTDRRGDFRIEGLAAGEYTVSVGSTAAERRELLGVEGTSSASLQSRRASAEVVEGLTTHVEIGAPGERLTRVRGLIAIDGEPLTEEPPSKGLLSARREGAASGEDSWEGALLNLDSEGSFVLMAEPGPWRFEVRPQREQRGYRPSRDGLVITRTVEIPTSADYHLELRFETGSLSGSIHGSDGAALYRVRVTLSGGDELNRVAQTATSYAEGSYRFSAVPAGRYTLRTQVRTPFSNAGGPRWIDESIESVFVSAGAETSNVDFTLRPGGGVRLESSAAEDDLAQTVLRLSNGVQSVECSYLARPQEFIARGLEPGIYEVTVASGPLVLVVPVAVDVTPGTWARGSLLLEPPRPR